MDPDKRRYAVPQEGPRHYIDIDHYGTYPFDSLPRKWNDAVATYSEDTLMVHGIVPWWLQTMLYRLTEAFKEKNKAKILKYSVEIGHYIAGASVPLHASSNHNGQFGDQKGFMDFGKAGFLSPWPKKNGISSWVKLNTSKTRLIIYGKEYWKVPPPLIRC